MPADIPKYALRPQFDFGHIPSNDLHIPFNTLRAPAGHPPISYVVFLVPRFIAR